MALERHFLRSFHSKAMLALVILETLAVIGLEGTVFYLIKSYVDTPSDRPITVYLSIFICSQIFQVYLVGDAFRMQNTIQLIGFVIYSCLCFVYSIIQIPQIVFQVLDKRGNVDPSTRSSIVASLIAVAIVIAICTVCYTWLVYKLYQEFGWKVFKKIGADLQKRRMYRDYHINLMLLKLDLFFFASFGLQFLVALDNQKSINNPDGTNQDIEYGLTIAALPITLLVLLIAAYALRREGRTTMYLFFLGLFLAMCYFVYKIIRIWTRKSRYEGTIIYLTVFASLSLIATFATFLQSVRCYLNFGKGLRPYLMGESTGVPTLAQSTNRMVLDDEEEEEEDEMEEYEIDRRRRPNIPSMQL